MHEVLFWLVAAFVLGVLFPYLPSSAGALKGGILAAVYPAVWGLGQLITGPLSDRWGRKHLITVGMLVQAIGSPDMVEGATAFLEKRPAEFHLDPGELPPDAP